MVRKSATLAADVERARLLALQTVYEAIREAAENSRVFYAGNVYDHDEPPVRLLEELRNHAVTLTALAPPVEIAPDAASEKIQEVYFSMFPGLRPTPVDEDGS